MKKTLLSTAIAMVTGFVQGQVTSGLVAKYSFIFIFIFSFYNLVLPQCCTCTTYGNELVYNGNFSLGNTGFSTSYTFANHASPGRYGIATNANLANPGYWGNCMDHTNGNGNFMWVDLSNNSSVNVWTQQINSILPNTNYLFSCWINTVDPTAPGTLQFSINSFLVGQPFTAPLTLCNWENFCYLWNSGNNTSATITITNQSQFASGNDIGIDDISFRECALSTNLSITETLCYGQNYQLPSGQWVNTTGTYIDTIQSILGCDSVITTSIYVHPPILDSVFVTICNGETYLLPGGNLVNSPGIYIDTLTSQIGCDSLVYTQLTLNPIFLLLDSVSICSNQYFVLPNQDTAFFSGTYYDTLLSNSGCDSIIITYLEVMPNVNLNVFDTICSGGIYILPDGTAVTDAGQYTVMLQSSFGCDSLIYTNLVVSSGLITQVFDYICFGEGYLMPDGQTIYTDGFYSYTLTSSLGCDSIVEITLTSLPQLQDSVLTKDLSCFGAEDGRIILALGNGNPPISYFVQNVGNNNSGVFENLSAGNYVYTITDGYGCSITDTVLLTQPDPMVISVNPSDTTIELHGYVPFNATCSFQNATFLWSPSTYLSCDTCGHTVSMPYSEMAYTITATTVINGVYCTAEKLVYIHMLPTLYTPNAFTPNGDGINDFFDAPNLNLAKLNINIFDRWGNKVYQCDDPAFKWDGTINSMPLPEGVYSFFIKGNNSSGLPVFVNGTITLLR